MDIARPASVAIARKRRRIGYGAAAGVAVLLITVGLSRLQPAAPEVERSTVLVDTVKRGRSSSTCAASARWCRRTSAGSPPSPKDAWSGS